MITGMPWAGWRLPPELGHNNKPGCLASDNNGGTLGNCPGLPSPFVVGCSFFMPALSLPPINPPPPISLSYPLNDHLTPNPDHGQHRHPQTHPTLQQGIL